MKKHNFVLGVALILTIVIGINAQIAGGAVSNDSDDSKLFQELQTKSWALKRNGPYREKSEKVFQQPGKEIKLVTIQEFAPPDRYRYESSTTVDGKTSTYESITIGEDMYFRENGGKWTHPKVETRTGAGVGNSTIKLVEKTTIDGKRVMVFEEKWNRYSDDKSSSGRTYRRRTSAKIGGKDKRRRRPTCRRQYFNLRIRCNHRDSEAGRKVKRRYAAVITQY